MKCNIKSKHCIKCDKLNGMCTKCSGDLIPIDGKCKCSNNLYPEDLKNQDTNKCKSCLKNAQCTDG